MHLFAANSQNIMQSNKRAVTDSDEVRENRPAKSQRQKQNSIHVQLSDEPCTLMDLDDYSLLDVLSYLKPKDLSAVQYTCRRLKRLSQDCFRTKCNNKFFHLKPSNGSYNLFRHFGEQMRRVYIDFNLFAQNDGEVQRIWSILFENCFNLTKLIFLDVVFTKFSHNRASALYRNLRELSICSDETKLNCYDSRRFILTCEKLKTLILASRNPGGIPSALLKHHYPKLKKILWTSFKGDNTEGGFEQKNLQEFLEKNPQIKAICFDFVCTEANSKIFVNIAHYSLNVELILVLLSKFNAAFVDDLASLRTLNKLKALKINCGGIAIGAAINAFAIQNQLNSLGIYTTMDEELVGALCKLTKLKIFELHETNGLNRKAVQELANAHYGLQHLTLSIENSMDFQNMLFFIELISNLRSLYGNMCPWKNYFGLQEDEFLQIVDARKRSGASNPLTVYLDSFSFNDAMKSIAKKTLLRNACHVQLINYDDKGSNNKIDFDIHD